MLAVGHLALLIVRFPQLIAWENADSDIASAYTLTDAIGLGHAGQVVMSTQGSWVPLGFGLLTHGLGFHRVLWEFLVAPVFLAVRSRDSTGLSPVIAVTIGSVVVALITSHIMRAMDLLTTTPSALLTRTLVGPHVKWLVQGLLRMGNGLSVAAHSSITTPLTVAAGIVTIGALVGMFWLAGRALAHPAAGNIGRARNLHTTFWAASLLCAAAAYVLTDVAQSPSDRYFIVAVPAVAATVPLLVGGRRSSAAVEDRSSSPV